MRKLFDFDYQNNKTFSVTDYNDKKNIELKCNINNLDYSQVDELYSLLYQYKQSKINKNLLKIISSKIEFERFNIKGICHKNNSSFSPINNYTEILLNKKKYNFTFILSKIFNKESNKIIFNEQNKYIIQLLINFPRAALLFTNLVAKLELDNITNQFHFIFKNTLKTKIYMDKNKIIDLKLSKLNFVSSGIFLDYLKSNEFTYIDSISTQKLYSLRNTKFKKNLIKGFNYELCLDLKLYLNIDSESLYLENLKEEYLHFYQYNKENISLCCFVKSIYKDINTKNINVML